MQALFISLLTRSKKLIQTRFLHQRNRSSKNPAPTRPLHGSACPPMYLVSPHWIPRNYRIKFKLLVLTYQILHKEAPEYIFAWFVLCNNRGWATKKQPKEQGTGIGGRLIFHGPPCIRSLSSYNKDSVLFPGQRQNEREFVPVYFGRISFVPSYLIQ